MQSLSLRLNTWALQRCAVMALVVALIGLQSSSTLVSVGFILAAVCSVAASSWAAVCGYIVRLRFLQSLVLLSIWMLFCVWHNPYSEPVAWHNFVKFVGKFAVFVCLLPVFSVAQHRTSMLVLARRVVLVFSVLFAVLIKTNGLGFLSAGYVLGHYINAIPWGYFLALGVYLSFNTLLDDPERRAWSGCLMLWLLYVIFFVNVERSAMLVTWLFIFVAVVQRFSGRQLCRALLAATILPVIVYLASATVRSRLAAFVADVHHYFSGARATGSIDLRLAFAKNSWSLIQQKWLVGFGLGSFPFAYHTTHGPSLPGVVLLGDPHNTYLHLWVELGLIGLVLFLLFMALQWIEAKQLPTRERRLAQALTITFAVMCCCVSALFRQRLVVLYLIMMAVCFGAAQCRSMAMPTWRHWFKRRPNHSPSEPPDLA